MFPLVRHTRHLGRYRQIVQVLAHHGFGYILEQLGLTRLLPLPRRVKLQVPPSRPTGVAERLVQVLIELGPTFIKIGQFISTRPDMLPPELVDELAKLQDTVPPFPSEKAIAKIEAELGKPISVLFREFSHKPLAAASLGQVHAAVLPNGDHVAVKVQRPDIAATIENDLEIIADLAALAQERTFLGEQYDLVELAWEFSMTLRRELDYNREKNNAERFRAIFANNTTVHIPRVYADYTTTHILTTERLFGAKINDLPDLKERGIDAKQIAQNSARLILHEIFNGFFHADPHPGNFFALPGEVIGAVDFGQVGILDEETTRQLIFLIMAIIQRDPDNALRALDGLGILHRQHVTRSVRRDIHLLIDNMVGVPLQEISMHVTGRELFSIVRRHKLRMPGTIATLLRALMMMEGVGLQLDPTLDVFGLAKPYVNDAIARQFSPEVLGKRVLERSRIIGEVALEAPEQLSNLLYRLNDGELRVQTRELEMRHLANALLNAANYLALSIILAAIILSVGLIMVAHSISGQIGTLYTVMLAAGTLAALVGALFLGLALLRGRDR